MRTLVGYILKSRRHAIIGALLCSSFPFLGWLGIVIICLVTLRKGAREGFYVMLWFALPNTVLAIAFPQIFIYNVIYGALLCWLLAIILRHTVSWSLVIHAILLIGLAAVMIVHLVSPNINQYWLDLFNTYYQAIKPALTSQLLSPEMLSDMISKIARLATGIQASMILLNGFLCLVMARWLQAMLYNTGGLRAELYQLRVNGLSIVILAALSLTAYLGMAIPLDMLPIALMPFMLSGLSFIHRLAAKRRRTWLLLISFYAAFTLCFIQTLFILTCISIIDLYIHIRGNKDGRYFIRKSS